MSIPMAALSNDLAHALRWLGRFHVVVIHFPVALLLAASAEELWHHLQRRPDPSPSVRVGVFLGAIGACAAVALGWLHADFGGYGAAHAEALTLHRWYGTTAAVWALIALFLSERDTRLRARSVVFRLVLWVGAIAMGATAHLGGTLVHGEKFFDW
jgi:cyanate permease